MQRRQLGDSDLDVSAIGLGCMRMSFGDRPMVGLDSRPEQIKRVAEASLKRLRVEAIDLFYQHRVDPNMPIEDVAGAVKELIQAGKVKHFGLLERIAAQKDATPAQIALAWLLAQKP